jgi:hypothetical protein
MWTRGKCTLTIHVLLVVINRNNRLISILTGLVLAEMYEKLNKIDNFILCKTRFFESS